MTLLLGALFLAATAKSGNDKIEVILRTANCLGERV